MVSLTSACSVLLIVPEFPENMNNLEFDEVTCTSRSVQYTLTDGSIVHVCQSSRSRFTELVYKYPGTGWKCKIFRKISGLAMHFVIQFVRLYEEELERTDTEQETERRDLQLDTDTRLLSEDGVIFNDISDLHDSLIRAFSLKIWKEDLWADRYGSRCACCIGTFPEVVCDDTAVNIECIDQELRWMTSRFKNESDISKRV